MLTIEPPQGIVCPAELPVASAVLDAACFEVHEPHNYNRLFQVLHQRHPQLGEELHYLMRPQQPVGAQSVMRVA
ncbi:hypothetical protein [Hymenobacter algoricola]|uniref:Uncharacterized protein n=1 Tax=Hymenobacter algoricola TaxID=486267 RepID=A0ABP7NTL9_9BACT